MEEKSKAVLTASNIILRFGGVKALAEVGFQVYRGEILALIGPNGAGKTCLLNCINGFYRPDPGGSILYRGAQLCGMKTYDIARLGIARVFQIISSAFSSSSSCFRSAFRFFLSNR
jgi:branched-chain amino acid transport system ATP-binding protein